MKCIRVFFVTFLGLTTIPSIYPENPCSENVSIGLEKGSKLDNGSILYDGLTFPPHLQFNINNELRGCPCGLTKCIRRCCPKGEALDAGVCNPIPNTTDVDFPPIPDGILDTGIESIDKDFYVIYEKRCLTKKTFALFLSGPKKFTTESFKITSDGILVMEQLKKEDPKVYRYEQERYCIAWSQKDQGTKFYSCLSPDERKEQLIVDLKRYSESIGNAISVLFLILTFIVYSLFSSLRNIHGKTLMGYVVSLAMAYGFLTIIKNHEIQNNFLNDASCQGIGMYPPSFFIVLSI